MSESARQAVLGALAGASPRRPVARAELGRRLGGMWTEAQLSAALHDLIERRAINTARISADGQHWQEVYWPTGITALAPPQRWRDFSFGGNAPFKPQPQEQIMPKVKAPAEPRRPGAVTEQILTALAGTDRAHAMTAEEIYDLCPASASLDSIRKMLARLHAQGRIQRDMIVGDGRTHAVYWLEGESEDAAPPPAGQAPQDDAPAGQALAEGALRFGLFDDGSLELWRGTDFLLRVDAACAERLHALLDDRYGG